MTVYYKNMKTEYLRNVGHWAKYYGHHDGKGHDPCPRGVWLLCLEDFFPLVGDIRTPVS